MNPAGSDIFACPPRPHPYQVKFEIGPIPQGATAFPENPAMAAKLATPPSSSSPARHTLSDVIDTYLLSPEWRSLADSTRRNWKLILERIRKRWGQETTFWWSQPHRVSDVVKWRNESSFQPRKADHQITVLHHLLSWARLHGAVSINAATDIPRLYKNGGRAEIIWHEEEIDRFCANAPLPVADGMRLAALTGLRRADLVGLRWDEIQAVKISRVTLKSRRRRKRAIIPMTPALRNLLEALRTRTRRPDVETVLVNSKGEAWSADGFGHRFNAVRDRLDIRHSDGRRKHLHDVRGTYATRLVRYGLSDQEVADVLGWSACQVADIRKIYVQDDAAIQALSEKIARMQQLVQPSA
jgi:integrase